MSPAINFTPITHIHVAVGVLHELLLPLLQPLVDDGVRALAVEFEFPVLAKDDRHPLADVVEVKDAKQLVRHLLPVFLSSEKAFGQLINLV